MSINDMIMIIACLIISSLSAYTDLTNRIIPNNLMYPSFLIAFPLNSIFSLINDQFGIYLRNFFFATGFSILLYALHYFSAGDSKLLIVLASAMPVCVYQETLFGWFPILSWFIILFSISFLYIISESVYYFLKGKQKYKKRISVKSIIKDYYQRIVIITALSNSIWLLFPSFFANNSYVIIIINYFLMVILCNNAVALSLVTTIVLAITDVGISVACGYRFGFNIIDFIYIPFIILIWLLQHIISSYNYYSISSDLVEKDMILSIESSTLMQMSSIKGLPIISTEDTRSKLTEDEAKSIHRWAKSKYGQPSVIVVRTLPFGLLIALGTIIFLIGRGIVLI